MAAKIKTKPAKNDKKQSSQSGLKSPVPPRHLKWRSPPSPFLANVYIPSFVKRLKTITARNKAIGAAKPSAFSNLPNAFGEKKPETKKTPHRISKTRMPGSERERFEGPYDPNFGKARETAIFTNEAALSSLSGQTSSSFFDPEVAFHSRKSQVRKRRTLEMVKPGTYEKRAHTMRAKILSKSMAKQEDNVEEAETDEEFKYFEQSENLLKAENSEAELKTQVFGENTKKDGFLEKLKSKAALAVEWWDGELIHQPHYSRGKDNARGEMITNLVQHPPPVKPLLARRNVDPVPLFLTDREKKKARRMRKRAKLEVQAERVRLGLEEPPDARVSLANVMRVLGNSAVQDPSAVERQVKAKVERRRMAHLLQNETRKLTPGERRQKKRRKAMEPTGNGVDAALFAIKSLSDGRSRFKVDVSAAQLNLTGVGAIAPRGCVVLVEGGPSGLRKFKRLMLQRIRWREERVGEGEESTEDEFVEEAKDVVLVWEV
ncbi:U4/U6 small nuclear ribonucleoprotein Prp3, partial [Bonamia ostreae]